ncbi:MAG: V4R domain-containing protein [Prochlorotrichaceae cyanobacterium]|jgi:predicted hydrocarbon binding protein
MISVADLLIDGRIPGNYFATDAYVHSDLELGLLENRRGDRLLAIPDTLIRAIYAGLDKETGQAARLVLFNCGQWWGKNFYARFGEELTDYYGSPLADMSMSDFLQSLRQCWLTHGWGTFDIDQSYQHRGFLIAIVKNSPFASHAPNLSRPVCFLEAGVFSSFFSQLAGRDVLCIQISCESQGADTNRFVIGLPDRLQEVSAMVDAKLDWQAIMSKLCG